MLRKIFRFFWSLRHEFTKYFVIGFCGLFLDMGGIIFLKEFFDWPPVFAVVVIELVVIFYVFTLNKYWTFRNRELPHRQFVRYLLLTGFDYFFGVATMFVFNQLLNFDYRLVRIFTIAVMVSWNFLLYKYWVYGVQLDKQNLSA